MRILLYILVMSFISACAEIDNKTSRPREPWAFRSVLDRQPRMLTLALDTACYAAYDLANCRLYKVWKGGVMLEGTAYTDKKNIQPTSWGMPYSNDLENKWSITAAGNNDSFKIINRGYKINSNAEITILYSLIVPGRDTISITEQPEFNNLSFTRTFSTR